jgi:hypothetical protein
VTLARALSRRLIKVPSLLVLVALVATLRPTIAAAQTGQMFGELVGKVTDDQGAVLPGVTVSLTGSAVMGTQTAITNEHGLYRFPALNSGTCMVKFELAGFAPLLREGIVVPVRQTITVDVSLKLASLQETVTVTGASPVVDVENAKVGARLDQSTLQAVPTSRTIFGSTTVLPGMTMARQDPGGLNAATSTSMVAHGAANYNLNYYGVTADTPQNYGSMYYMDFGSAEEISVDTAAMGAEVGGGGGANINIIPKSGGNDIKGEAFESVTGPGYWSHFAGNNITPALAAQGITLPSLQKLNDFNADAGGPILKDRLWWFGSFRNYSTTEATPGYTTINPDGSLTNPFDSNLRNYTASGKYQINNNNHLSVFWTYNRKYQPNRNAGVNQPFPAGTLRQESPKNLFNGNWTSVRGQNTFLEVSSSYFHMHWPSSVSDAFAALPDSQKSSPFFNQTTAIWFNGPEPTGEHFRDAYRAQTNIGLTHYTDGLLGGSHQFKAGFENWYGWGQEIYDLYGDTAFVVKNNPNGSGVVPVQFSVFNTPLNQKTHMRNFAGFIQDRATYSKLTVNLGLRWSYYDGYLPPQTGGGGTWSNLFPLTNYPQLDSGFHWNTFAPRTSAVYKLTEDGRNVLKASYSRYYEVMYTGEFADVINPNTINTISATNGTGGLATYKWDGSNPASIVANNAPTSRFSPSLNSINPNLKDPWDDEITFGYQRELLANVGFSVGWVQRWFKGVTLNEEVGIPANGYTPHSFVDPGPDNIVGTADDRTITLYDVLPQYKGQNVAFHTNSTGTQRYKGLELSVSKRMSNHWQMLGSYVWSRLDGDLVATTGTLAGDPNNPNQMIPTNSTGRGLYDQPHAFKLLGSYQAPYGITLGANYQALSGLPIDRTIRENLVQGAVTVRADPRGTYRADFLNLLSFRADKGFRLNGSRRVLAVAEIHNLLNSSSGQNSYGATTQSFASEAAFQAAQLTTSYFGRVQEIIAPRILKLGVKFEF